MIQEVVEEGSSHIMLISQILFIGKCIFSVLAGIVLGVFSVVVIKDAHNCIDPLSEAAFGAFLFLVAVGITVIGCWPGTIQAV